MLTNQHQNAYYQYQRVSSLFPECDGDHRMIFNLSTLSGLYLNENYPLYPPAIYKGSFIHILASIYCCFLLFHMFVFTFIYMGVCIWASPCVCMCSLLSEAPDFIKLDLEVSMQCLTWVLTTKLSSSGAIWAFNHLCTPFIIFLIVEMLTEVMCTLNVVCFNSHFSDYWWGW